MTEKPKQNVFVVFTRTREPQNKSICPSEILNRRSNSPVRNMVTLKKGKDVTKDSVSSTPISPGLKSIEEWVQAAEFTPGQPWKGAGMDPNCQGPYIRT